LGKSTSVRVELLAYKLPAKNGDNAWNVNLKPLNR